MRRTVSDSAGHVPLVQLAPRAGFEPATIRLTVECSTAELPRNRRNPMGRDGLRITKPQSLAKREIGRSHATSTADANCLRGKDLLPFLTTRKMRSGTVQGDPAPRLRCG